MSEALPIRITRAATRAALIAPWVKNMVRRASSGTVTVLLYHRIAEHSDEPWLESSGLPYTTPRAFRDQLAYLKSVGGRIVTMDEALAEGFECTDARFVISFDDGYADNFAVARATLEDFGARGLFFITSSVPDRNTVWDHKLAWYSSQDEARDEIEKAGPPGLSNVKDGPWRVRHLQTPSESERLLADLDERYKPITPEQIAHLYADWSDIADAATSGHQIGVHGVHHRMRCTITESEFRSEIAESKLRIETKIGQRINAFAYPFNGHFFTDEEICKEQGFTQIFTVDPGRLHRKEQLGAIPRRTVFGIHDSSPRFKELLLEEGFAH